MLEISGAEGMVLGGEFTPTVASRRQNLEG